MPAALYTWRCYLSNEYKYVYRPHNYLREEKKKSNRIISQFKILKRRPVLPPILRLHYPQPRPSQSDMIGGGYGVIPRAYRIWRVIKEYGWHYYLVPHNLYISLLDTYIILSIGCPGGTGIQPPNWWCQHILIRTEHEIHIEKGTLDPAGFTATLTGDHIIRAMPSKAILFL